MIKKFHLCLDCFMDYFGNNCHGLVSYLRMSCHLFNYLDWIQINSASSLFLSMIRPLSSKVILLHLLKDICPSTIPNKFTRINTGMVVHGDVIGIYCEVKVRTVLD